MLLLGGGCFALYNSNLFFRQVIELVDNLINNVIGCDDTGFERFEFAHTLMYSSPNNSMKFEISC